MDIDKKFNNQIGVKIDSEDIPHMTHIMIWIIWARNQQNTKILKN